MREAVSAKFAAENNLAYDIPEIIVSNGAKQVIFNALMATLEPGDEVLLCAPHFDPYASMVRVLGGVPILLEVREETGFILQPEVLGIAITERTRWLFLNSRQSNGRRLYCGGLSGFAAHFIGQAYRSDIIR